jgi:hypothetical protein
LHCVPSDPGTRLVKDAGVVVEPPTTDAEPGVRIAQDGALQSVAVHAPEVLRVGDGPSAGCRMYDAGWRRDPDTVLHIGRPFDRGKCSEPCVIRLPDGRSRIFYEASDEHAVWRILSATTPAPPAAPAV